LDFVFLPCFHLPALIKAAKAAFRGKWVSGSGKRGRFGKPEITRFEYASLPPLSQPFLFLFVAVMDVVGGVRW
jgi:hypothetical protein